MALRTSLGRDWEFHLWWVSVVGRPPILDDGRAFELARLAWRDSRVQLRRVKTRGGRRSFLATARRPERGGDDA